MGLPRGPRRRPRRDGAGAGRRRRWRCCTRARSCTTTNGRLRHAARAAGHPPRVRGAAPRSRAGPATPSSTAPPRRSCSATCCCPGPTSCSAAAGMPHDVVRDALAFFDTTRSEVIAGPVPRRLGAGAGRVRRRAGDAGAALQVREVLHRAAAARRGRPGRRRRRRCSPSLTEFGLPLGEAFQLRDDLLGVVRRPGGDRQAGRRRPHRGQADRAGRAGPRRARRRRGREAARRRARLAARRRRGRRSCARIIDDSGRARRGGAPDRRHSPRRSLAALDAAPVTDAARDGAPRPRRRGDPAHRL